MITYAPLIGGVMQPPKLIRKKRPTRIAGFFELTLDDGTTITAHQLDICKIKIGKQQKSS